MLVDIAKRQLSVDESKVKLESQKLSIENRVLLMKQVKSLRDESFLDRETLGIFPEAKGMLDVD